MSNFQIFDLAAQAMNAQNVRMNTTASNLANAETVSGTPENAYKPKYAYFSAVMDDFTGETGVQVSQILESNQPANAQYNPEHPLADQNGYVYTPSVNAIEEMANMMAASRSYQMNAEMASTSKQMLLKTLSTLGGG